jgi:hypothetical protein
MNAQGRNASAVVGLYDEPLGINVDAEIALVCCQPFADCTWGWLKKA